MIDFICMVDVAVVNYLARVPVSSRVEGRANDGGDEVMKLGIVTGNGRGGQRRSRGIQGRDVVRRTGQPDLSCVLRSR